MKSPRSIIQASRSQTAGRRAWPACWYLSVLLLGVDIAAACSSSAEEPTASRKPFSLRLGTYYLDSSTEARVDGRGGNIGTRLDFEDDLGIEDRKNTFLAHLSWWIRGCHMVDVSYFKLSRSGETRAENEFRFGEVVVPVGANVNSSFTTEVTRISYSYRFLERKTWEAAFSAGLHVTRLAARLNTLQFDNVGTPITDREIASVTAPLPVLGVSVGKYFSEKWTAGFRTQWFFLEVDEYDGAIGHASAMLTYQAFDQVGLGFGYDWFDVDVRTEDRFWTGAVDVRFNGPLIFLQAEF